MTTSDRETIEGVLATLLEEQQGEAACYCGEVECTIEDPVCSSRRRLRSIRDLQRIVEPAVTTRHPERLTNPSERIFFEAAKRLGDKRWTNDTPALARILSRDLQKAPSPPSADEAEIVGTFAQWLGTNCGYAFLHEANRQIEAERAERSAWGVDLLPPLTRKFRDWAEQHAERLVHTDLPHNLPEARNAHARVAHALRQLMVVLAFRSGATSGDDAAAALGMQTAAFIRMTEKACEVARASVSKQESERVA